MRSLEYAPRHAAGSVRTPAGVDVAGVALSVGAVAWIFAASAIDGGNPLPLAELAIACGVAVWGAAAGSRRLHRSVVPISVAALVSAVALANVRDLTGGPLSGPFGYRNATGAFLAIGAVAWVMVGAALGGRRSLAAAAIPAALLGATAMRASVGTTAVVVLVPIAALSLRGPRGARAAVAICGVLLGFALLATTWLGIAYRTDAAGRVASLGLTQRRLDLWHDAVQILADKPFGVGPGRFASMSPTALGDRDAQQAHQEFLERGAELGWIGLALMVAIFAWAFVRLWRTPGADAVTALAAVALAGVGIHASIDYVLHAPAIPLAVAALLGTGITGGSPRANREPTA